MYASQPTIDPQDDRRIYMLNPYSFSDNGGETFTSPHTTTHGDDRFVWVNPKDSRHVIKLDDGGIGISLRSRPEVPLRADRCRCRSTTAWPWTTSGPTTSTAACRTTAAGRARARAGPTSGILNEHWSRLCGGDGFFAVPDPTNPRLVFSASQFLGLQRNDTRTWQSQDIRPGDPQGAIGDRRNWNTWGKNVPEQVLGNAMHPANWDAPVVLSPHDPATIYAGGKHLFRSRDRGTTWEDLGDMTTGVDRATLPLMGRMPDENMLSIDDGVPYYPGLVAIAPSPLQQGPASTWAPTMAGCGCRPTTARRGPTCRIACPACRSRRGSAASRRRVTTPSTVYVAVDNHRSNDLGNYIYKSTDGGKTFTSIAGDLPAGRVVRTMREDSKNPNLLFAGTEIGLFFSPNGGTNWIELKNNMPTLPLNDLVIHPRDNDLVLGTHGRGIWILDKINALQELTPQVIASPRASVHGRAGVPDPPDQPEGAHRRHVVPRREPRQRRAGRLLAGAAGTAPAVTVHDAGRSAGQHAARHAANRGVNRVVWNLRHADLPIRGGFGGDDDAPAAGAACRGRWWRRASTPCAWWPAGGRWSRRWRCARIRASTSRRRIASCGPTRSRRWRRSRGVRPGERSHPEAAGHRRRTSST